MNRVSSEDKPPKYDETMQNHSHRSQYRNYDEYIDEGDFEEEDEEMEQHFNGGDDETLNTTTAVVKRIVDHENYIKKQIELNYPTLYVIIDSAVMIALNLVLIGLQVYATRNNAALSYFSSAIWAALYNLATVALLLSTLKFRSSTLIMLTSTLKLFGMIISFVGFVLINLVAFYHYNCKAVSYYRSCYNADMKPIHYAIIGVGIPCMLQSVAVFVYFQFKLLARHKFVAVTAPVSNSNSHNQHFDLTFALSI